MRALMLAATLVLAAQAQSGWDAERTRALQLLVNGKSADAINVLEGAVKRYPREAGAHYELGDALLDQVRADAIAGASSATRVPRLERVVALLRRAMSLDTQYLQIGAAKLLTVYEEDGFERPAEVERLSRDLMTRDPASGIWAIKLAQSLAAQQRCSEAGRVMVAAQKLVEAERQLLFGMSMTNLFLQCPTMPLADARPLLEAAGAIATEALKATPDDRDVLMFHGATLTALASALPDGPEKKALEERGAQVASRFMDLNPRRQAALRGEAPDVIYDGFAYVNEFLDAGKTAEAEKLLASMAIKHAKSAEFWSTATFVQQRRGKRDEALAAAKRHVELSPPGPEPHLLMGNLYAMWALDETAPPKQRLADLAAAQAAYEAALKIDPNDIGGLIGKSDALKTRAALEQDPTRKQALLAESREWSARAGEAIKAKQKP